MKRCPTCQRTFPEGTQKFCANDGTPLVADEAPAFDPEATVLSSATRIKEEADKLQEDSSPPELQPTQYFSPASAPPSPPEPDIHQSYSPPPGSEAPPARSPEPPAAPPPQYQQPSPPPPQPYYPQPEPTGGQPPPQWQSGQPAQPPPAPWMPGQPQPQGQNWGAPNYYPQQPGQLAAATGKSMALSLVTLIVGVLGFVNWAFLFSMYNRIIPPDRSVAEIIVYVMLVFSILAVLLGVVTLISSRWRSKALAIVGVVLSLPGIIFFIYLAAEGRLP